MLPGRQCEGWDVFLCDFSGSLDNGFWQSSAKRLEDGMKGEASRVLPLPLSSSWHFMATPVSFGLAASHWTAPPLEGSPQPGGGSGFLLWSASHLYMDLRNKPSGEDPVVQTPKVSLTNPGSHKALSRTWQDLALPFGRIALGL